MTHKDPIVMEPIAFMFGVAVIVALIVGIAVWSA